jgi:hypothetical protein
VVQIHSPRPFLRSDSCGLAPGNAFTVPGKLRASWSHEFVTDSLNSHDQLGMTGILLQLVPQARHVHIDCTCQCGGVIAPNRT